MKKDYAYCFDEETLQAIKMFGKMIGRNWVESVHDDLKDSWFTEWAINMHLGHPVSYEVFLMRSFESNRKSLASIVRGVRKALIDNIAKKAWMSPIFSDEQVDALSAIMLKEAEREAKSLIEKHQQEACEKVGKAIQKAMGNGEITLDQALGALEQILDEGSLNETVLLSVTEEDILDKVRGEQFSECKLERM